MIVVTRLNDSQFAVNPDLIERIHAHPDTTLVMVDGSTFIVTETMNEIIEMIAQYRAHVIALARNQPLDTDPGFPRLGPVAVPDVGDEGAERAGEPAGARPQARKK